MGLPYAQAVHVFGFNFLSLKVAMFGFELVFRPRSRRGLTHNKMEERNDMTTGQDTQDNYEAKAIAFCEKYEVNVYAQLIGCRKYSPEDKEERREGYEGISRRTAQH